MTWAGEGIMSAYQSLAESSWS